MLKPLIASLSLLAGPTVAQAQTVIVGAGYADFSDDSADDQGMVSLEYHHSPFHEATRFSATWGGALSVHENGDTHIGVGLVGLYALNDRWFVEGSVMPGAFFEADDVNDLGGEFQIRSLLALGYTFDSGNRLSLAITHKSNASTNEFNPGVNAALVRFHKSF